MFTSCFTMLTPMWVVPSKFSSWMWLAHRLDASFVLLAILTLAVRLQDISTLCSRGLPSSKVWYVRSYWHYSYLFGLLWQRTCWPLGSRKLLQMGAVVLKLL
jgi:hypothetical protein